MLKRTSRKLPLIVQALFFTAALAACDTAQDPLGLEEETPPQPTVVAGQVTIPSSPMAAGPSAGSDISPAGVLVTVDGTQASDITDAGGAFRLEAVATERKMTLRFRKGSLDTRIELRGVTPGALIQVAITLQEDSASVSESHNGNRMEFEGLSSLSSVAGAAPDRTLRLMVADSTGSLSVDVNESSTAFEVDGDIRSFSELLSAVEAGKTPKLEGEGTLQPDGSVAAAWVKVETDEEDDDADDLNEFDGSASLLSVGGTAPARTLSVTVEDSTGTKAVDIIEGSTTFDNEGDILSFADALAALQAGTAVKMEGKGTLQPDGSIAATEVKVETDDVDDTGDNHEFDGAATFVSVAGTAPARTLSVTVADSTGTKAVKIIEGSTTFDNEGDILSFADALAALQAGAAVKMEGEGALQPDGSIAATEVKVETDDDETGNNHEFDGAATFVSIAGTAPARTLRVTVADSIATKTVDIIEGTTRFHNEGDLLTFGDALAALQAGAAVKMEGEGTLQPDGAIAATEVKVETDD